MEQVQEIHPLYCALLLHLAKITGLEPEKICNTSQLERIKVRQHPRWFVALLSRIQKACQHPTIHAGFEYGRCLDLACAGVIGQAVMTAPTLGVALKLTCRYYILMGPKFHFASKKVGKRVSLSIDLAYNDVPEQVRSFVFEALISSWIRCVQVLIGKPFIPKRLAFDYTPPAHAHLYSKYFQCEVSFNCPQTVIEINSDLLSVPILTANAVVHERSFASCEAALLKRGEYQSLSEKVRKYLKTSQELPYATLDAVAHSMNFSSRTLNRRLQLEGNNFQKLLDEQRSQQACRLLVRSDLNLDRIAEHLGYSDPSNFRRAFKRWTGETPSQYRKTH